MRFIHRLLQLVFLATATLIFLACAKPEEKKAEEAPSTAANHSPVMEQTASNRGTASAAFGDKSVSINYGRPQLQGRDVLAMATDGMVWRMGMNEATEIKTDADLKFGETLIPAGSYSLWMKKVASDKWDLVFNKKTGIWGHEHPAADDFASAPMTMSTLQDTVETFTVEVKSQDATNGNLTAMWGTAALSAAFTLQAAEGK
jgi:hypothetical protein